MARYLIVLTTACLTRQDLQNLVGVLNTDQEVKVVSLLATQTHGKMFLDCQCSDRSVLDAFLKGHNLRPDDVFRIEFEAQDGSLVDV